ncbi:type IV toxin-antitoxin system AbiEi family antitoxin domain-containing protein [candidate division WOR-3 bacterium]|nr:type IV toxin-antitoxin system AbiEi family antitoxin domain-containing protein [candidate division WOR-3 bacterium]
MTGLGKLDRKRLAAIIRGTKDTITVQEASKILSIAPSDAAKLLARWTQKGWLSRVRRGMYVQIPLESRTTEMPLEDPWVIAERLFAPCYIGGWSAAEYWDLTEQVFRTIVVITVQKPRNRSPVIKGTKFLLRTTSAKFIFGLKSIWRGQTKVSVSDPSRTIIDMLAELRLGGGIRLAADMFTNYLNSGNKNLPLLIEYAKRLNNGAVFKRLGFLLERLAPAEKSAIDDSRSALTTGYIKLDPALNKYRLVTRWRLWLPRSWDSNIQNKV